VVSLEEKSFLKLLKSIFHLELSFLKHQKSISLEEKSFLELLVPFPCREIGFRNKAIASPC